MATQADPKTSAGARTERKAFRQYLTRLKRTNYDLPLVEQILAWVLSRQARYDRRRGGLGK